MVEVDDVEVRIGDGRVIYISKARYELLRVCTCPWWTIFFGLHRSGCKSLRCIFIEEVKP